MNKIKDFGNKQARTVWNSDEEEWYFFVVDVIEIIKKPRSAAFFIFRLPPFHYPLGDY